MHRLDNELCLLLYVTALSDWLPALGYAYENLVPQMSSDNRAVGVAGTMTSSCGGERACCAEFDAVYSTPSLRLHSCRRPSVGFDDKLTLSVRPYMFGAGVIISSRTATDCVSNCQRVTVDATADTDLSRLAVMLLNNSVFLTRYFNVTDRRQVHQYIKPSSTSQQLHHVIAYTSTTSSDTVSSDTVSTVSVNQLSRHEVHVIVANDVTVLHVRHVTWSLT